MAVDCGEYDADVSLAELEELAKTAGAEVIGRLWQKRDKPDNALFLGSGRLEELGEFCENNEIDLVIADSELSPAQLRSLFLILASVVLWFMGYNAVTSKYSVYAGSVLNLDYNATLIIAHEATIYNKSIFAVTYTLRVGYGVHGASHR